MLKLKSRILLNNGISIVDIEILAERIIHTGTIPPHIKTKQCDDTDKYKLKYGIDLSHPVNDILIEPTLYVSNDDKINVITKILSSTRHDHTSNIAEERLTYEIDFFYISNNLEFLCVCSKLIDNFKNDGVVWGCGRGSSCASYVLYLLEVHDVNPIKYGIEFKEFSKE